MIDNFDKIRNLLEFRSQDDFYFLQILQRKKDNEKGKVNGSNNNSRLIKAYYIKNLEYFDFVKPEVIELCKVFNARAGFNLNRRSFERMALQHLKKVTDQLLNKSYNKVHKAYPSVVGAYNDDSDKKWIIDIDKDQMIYLDIVRDLLNDPHLKPVGDKIIIELPSKSGLHIITKPFDLSKWNLDLLKWNKISLLNIEIHKNNPTNIYIP